MPTLIAFFGMMSMVALISVAILFTVCMEEDQ